METVPEVGSIVRITGESGTRYRVRRIVNEELHDRPTEVELWGGRGGHLKFRQVTLDQLRPTNDTEGPRRLPPEARAPKRRKGRR